MKTSQKQISQNGEDASMFSREDFHASRLVLQASEKERKMTVTSGQKCCEQYGRYSQLGSLVKTLLVSSQWFSPARRLKWDVQTICSKRISYTEQSSNSRLPPSVKTLNVQDIQSKRLLFRLVPSERHTDATECGLLQGLIPTPLASDAQGGAAKLTKGARRRNGQGFSAALKDLAASKMLPTPQTQGLKVCNKNGKKIFEGDIVGNNGFVHLIKYVGNLAGFFTVSRELRGSFGYFDQKWIDYCDIVVVGNVTDNPELLK